AHVDEGASVVTHLLLVVRAESFGPKCALGEHGVAARAFEAVCAEEVGGALLQVAEPWNVKAPGAAVIERTRLANQILHDARYARAHQVLAEVVADMGARISDPI